MSAQDSAIASNYRADNSHEMTETCYRAARIFQAVAIKAHIAPVTAAGSTKVSR